MNLGLYIHIPFCRRKCDYCSFYSIPVAGPDKTKRDLLIHKYVDKLLDEIDRRAISPNNYKVDTVYFGGGTPSLISPDEIVRILEKIKSYYTLDDDIEITLECNPEDFSIARMNEYRDMGINRIVLGVQTLNKRLHDILGRSSILCNNILDDYFSINGITHCIDLIIGIPTQSVSELKDELKILCEYRPEHISAYMLSIDKHTRLYARIKNSPELEDEQKKIFKAAIETLRECGYNHYEVSNFSLPSFESSHNMKYWLFMPYIGFGSHAHTFIEGKRLYNSMTVEEYINCGSISLVDDSRPRKAEMVEFILTRMRLLAGISIRDFESVFNDKLPESVFKNFLDMVDEGYLSINGSDEDKKFKMTEKGLFFLDSVIYRIVEPLL